MDRWGAGYFNIDENGNMVVYPLQEQGAGISILEALQEALEEGLRPPLLIRFQDLLRHRVVVLNEAFKAAIEEHQYRGIYRGVYPIKVNQLHEVVEEILDAGRPYSMGLEVGSKPEMFAALSVHNDPEALIICNGYKDEKYIRMALLGRKLNKKVIIVAEKLSEVEKTIQVAREMQVEPLIGLRIRLAAKGAGRWARSGGEHAKFGLTTSEILMALDLLEESGYLPSLKLLHFHIGSQIPDILNIKSAVREASRYYSKLYKMGHQLEYLDVGGGLAVDYDGSRSTFHSSMNYTLEEYAQDVIYNIMDICDQEGVPHPNVISESGRAIVAAHSVLVVEAFGSIRKSPTGTCELPTEDHKLIQDMLYTESHLTAENLTESWHDVVQVRQESEKMFELGLLDLKVKASVEMLYWRIVEEIQRQSQLIDESELPEELLELDWQLAEQHICNFSVFQSLLDHWALGQLFPIAPIHRLNEKPAAESTLVDITCDSDGRVSKFIDTADVRETLPLHSVQDNQPYYLGIFLTGAYQDIMGDIHNLFGRVNEVHIFLDEDEESGFYIEEKIPGNSISDVLAMTQYDSRELIKRLKAQIDAAIKADLLRPNEGMKLLSFYEQGLAGQTYLEID
ncbi:MAG TPA: biosynthetic arginine decarboxylase [Acidobacteriota bacterium]|nr:biosynthetic arginine decarboxylase [Acidobacteriota bacterium]